MKGIRTRVAGFNHHAGSADALIAMRTGTELRLEADPTNSHDPNAIKIFTPKGLLLGFVPRTDNAGVLRRIKDPDVLVRCVKTDGFNAVTITYQEGDPLA